VFKAKARREKQIFYETTYKFARVLGSSEQQRFLKNTLCSSQNSASKITKKTLVNATYPWLEMQEITVFSKNNVKNLKILLARHFWCSRTLIINGRLRIKSAFCTKFQFLCQEMPTTKIFFTKNVLQANCNSLTKFV